jgi:hypothetical protein
MDTLTVPESDLGKQLELLEEQIRKNEVNIEGFQEAYQLLDKARWKLQELLEWATAQKRDDRELYRLYGRIARQNSSELIDRLRGLGYRYQNDAPVKDAFNKQGYRLLEQTRNGKRQDVFYGILRIFVSLQKEVPLTVVEAFKPIYSDELFKVFIFTFLSGVLGKEET